MRYLKAVLEHPDDLYPLLKLKMAAMNAEKEIPTEAHWGFCYLMLHKVSRSFALVIQQLETELRDAVCVFYLILRGLDTIEDDTSIDTMVKIPILMEFHGHIYDPDWHFECGTKEYRILMDQFHHVSTAFLELNDSYQEAIEDITMKMGAGMAKFICKEVDTIKDYEEYCHYVAGLVGFGLSKLFHASGKEMMYPESISNSMGIFLQKTNIIRDFLEDINETPKPRMFWPKQIWSKYIDKVEDLKQKENSRHAIECLNEMVTNALVHTEDCLKYLSNLSDPTIFKFCAIPQIMAIGTLTLCYNNIEVFRGVVKLRRGLTAKIIDRTKTMADVYGAFNEFSSLLRSKVNLKDPNAQTTISRIEATQKICKDLGTLDKKKSYILGDERGYGPPLLAFLIVVLAILYVFLSPSLPNKASI
uniref:Squalene synthase n=1 Tax=Ayapana triplinervis TaxID=1090619 RepID=A0AA96UYF1_9ASTR|nr:squalene synthase 2 [Ayapana triplinervis]